MTVAGGATVHVNKIPPENFSVEKMSGLKEIKIIVKWSGKEYEIGDLTEQDTVALLKHEICKRTNVQPNRQKLLNLKYKGECFGANSGAPG